MDHSLIGDAPLTNPAEDRLGRGQVAKRISDSIMQLDVKHGFVLGLQGTWGTGKTTMANFIKHYLDKHERNKPITLAFNPWWFGSSEDILIQFFAELSSTINRSDASKGLRKIAASVDLLGKAAACVRYIPGMEPAAVLADTSKAISEAVNGIVTQREQNLSAIRQDICKVLQRQQRKIVVFIDDLDRLSIEELKQMFAIIKAIANFPNVIYVLAYDRQRTAHILDTAQEDGYAYLEKIVQINIEVPAPIGNQLLDFFIERVGDSINIDRDSEEYERFGNVFLEAIQPLLQSPRDVNRYTNAYSLAHSGLGNEVNTVDLLGIELLTLDAD